MAEEKGELLEHFGFTEVTDTAIEEIERGDKELKENIKQDSIDLNFSTEAAISESVRSPQEQLYEDLEERKGRFSKEMTNDEINEELAAWNNEYTNYYKNTERQSFVVELLSAILPWLTPFVTAMSQASIIAEKSIAQPLRKKFNPQLLTIEQAITALHRDKNYYNEFKETLSRHGLNESDIDKIIKVSEVIPQAQDVIQFAVREVYTPRAVKDFGLMTGLDEIEKQARPDVERTGMKWEEFEKYWAAHWRLPGVREGFEMYHRGEINEEQLRLLLRASDIMPGFIEPLIAIAFSPFTRVDVRRMHKLGVLDEKGVKRAYMDLGYDEEKAQKLLEFTIAYNADPEENEQTAADKRIAKEKDLTKNDILGAYKVGLMTAPEVEKSLIPLGYSKEEVQFYISRLDFLAERERIEELLKWYKKAYTTWQWNETDTISALNALNLPAQELEYLLLIWSIERNLKIERPSKAEILGFFKKGLITEPEARQELKAHGYSDKYIDWFIKAQGVTT